MPFFKAPEKYGSILAAAGPRASICLNDGKDIVIVDGTPETLALASFGASLNLSAILLRTLSISSQALAFGFFSKAFNASNPFFRQINQWHC